MSSLNCLSNFIWKITEKLEENNTMMVKPNLFSWLLISSYELARLKFSERQEERRKVPEKKKKILEVSAKVTKELAKKLGEIDKWLEGLKSALIKLGYSVIEVKIRAVTRAIIGTSEKFGQLPFEVGLCFDPLFNLPFIPASSIKGAIRDAYIWLVAEDLQKKGKRKNEAYKEAENEASYLFGSAGGEGAHVSLVGFTDAYPIRAGDGGYLLHPDVLTPHYSHARTELDAQPTPVVHMVIAPGTTFKFLAFYLKRESEYFMRWKKLTETGLARVLNRSGSLDPRSSLMLIRAMIYAFLRGVGAKTTVSYSRFHLMSLNEVREE